MPARKNSGFTLIELLVVIAIIAILAAILFPVFARAREAARKSTCQSNMKECAIALQQYWNDYDACIPSSWVGMKNANSTWNPNGLSTPTPDNARTTYMATVGTIPPNIAPNSGVVWTWPMMLYEHMGRNRDIMWCPSDPKAFSTVATETVSYWWKTAADDAWWDPNIVAQKEGDFAYNAEQVIFYERAGFHSGDQAQIGTDVQINAAFMDSHVKNITVSEANDNGTPATPYKVGTAATDAVITQSHAPMYWNFDNDPGGTGLAPPIKILPTKKTRIDPRRYSDKF